MTKASLLIYLPLLLFQCFATVVVQSAGPHYSLRFLDGQDPSKACTVEELVEYCPDEKVDSEGLVAHCVGTHSLGAVKCYMKYLCEYHDQKAVEDHKSCMDTECPLAKRMNSIDCEAYLETLEEDHTHTQEQEEATDDTTVEDTATEEEEEDTNDNGDATGDDNGDADAEKEEEDTNDNDNDNDNADEEEDEDSNAAGDTGDEEKEEEGDEPEEEELIEEEVTVDASSNPNMEHSPGEGDSTASKNVKKGRGTKIFLFVVVPILAVLGFMAMRGKKENFPFDEHIEARNDLNLTSLTPGAGATIS